MTTLIDSARPVVAAMKAATGYVVTAIADLVEQIVNGIKGLAPLVLAFGCQGGEVSQAPSPAPSPVIAVSVVPPDAAVVDDSPRPLGKFNITFYYVIGEEEVAPKKVVAKAANDNRAEYLDDETLAAVAAPDLVTLYGAGCDAIAQVSPEFASELGIQGTGKLRDGRVLNVWGACNCGRSPCFKVTANQWGTAGSGHPLQPFRTVAVDPKVVKLGSLLYVPLLEGRLMPGRAPFGGFVHDGCVIADDTGGGMTGNKLDLFVGRKGYFLGLSGSEGSHSWAKHVPVFDGSKLCERKGRQVGRKSGAI
jgi:3D (Asp-Asp-Asp) domain-containing protein